MMMLQLKMGYTSCIPHPTTSSYDKIRMFHMSSLTAPVIQFVVEEHVSDLIFKLKEAFKINLCSNNRRNPRNIKICLFGAFCFARKSKENINVTTT